LPKEKRGGLKQREGKNMVTDKGIMGMRGSAKQENTTGELQAEERGATIGHR